MAKGKTKELEINEEDKKDKEIFNKGKEIVYHQVIGEELSYEDISSQIYNLINPVDAVSECREYNFYIRELFQSYVIVGDWNGDENMYKINYTISNDVVSIDSKEQWIAVELVYQAKGSDAQAELNSKSEEVIQLNKKVEDLNNLVIFSKEAEIKVEEKIAELEAKIEAMTKDTEVITQEFEAKITVLEQDKTELSEYKTKWEEMEKQNKVKEISDKYQKLISEKGFATEEVQSAIQELNEDTLKDMVIAEMSEKMKEVETASTKTDDVVIQIAEGKDLIPKSAKEKLYAEKE